MRQECESRRKVDGDGDRQWCAATFQRRSRRLFLHVGVRITDARSANVRRLGAREFILALVVICKVDALHHQVMTRCLGDAMAHRLTSMFIERLRAYRENNKGMLSLRSVG